MWVLEDESPASEQLDAHDQEAELEEDHRCRQTLLSKMPRDMLPIVAQKLGEPSANGGSRNTIFGRRRTISVRRFARSHSNDKSQPVAKSADKSHRKPNVAVCSKILGARTPP